jgi:hypothetical protein
MAAVSSRVGDEMPKAGSNRKRQRAKKVSRGINGAGRHPLGTVAKALLGKGIVQSMKHIPIKKNWSGTFSVDKPFDPEQAAIYKEEHPWS